MLMAWSGIAFAHHVEGQADEDSQMTLSKQPIDHGKLEKSCHLCSHLFAQEEALYADGFRHALQRDMAIETLPAIPAGLMAIPPPTPPP